LFGKGGPDSFAVAATGRHRHGRHDLLEVLLFHFVSTLQLTELLFRGPFSALLLRGLAAVAFAFFEATPVTTIAYTPGTEPGLTRRGPDTIVAWIGHGDSGAAPRIKIARVDL